MRLAFPNTWRRRARRASGSRTGRPPLPAAQVRVEALEDRALPSTGAPIVPTVGPPANWIVYQQITQHDGKIVIVGSAADFAKNPSDAEAYDFAVARYNPDGSLDTTFGDGGMVLTALNRGRDAAYDVVVQPDGKLVVVGAANAATIWDASGNYTTEPGGLALVRYNPDGSRDATFGSGGEVITSFPFDSGLGVGEALAVALQPDGAILVGGTATGTYPVGYYGFNEFTVARYTADGSLDSNFGDGGAVQISFGGIDTAQAVTVETDGTILATGTSYHTIFDPAMYGIWPDGHVELPPSYTVDVSVLLDPDGSLNTDFGNGGEVTSGPPQGPLSIGDGGGAVTPADGSGPSIPPWIQYPTGIGEGGIRVLNTGSITTPGPGPGNVVAPPAMNGSGSTGSAASVSPSPAGQNVAASQLAGIMSGQSVQASPLPTGGSPRTPASSNSSVTVGTPTNGAPTAAANPIGNSRLKTGETTSADTEGDGNILAPPESFIESGDGVAALRDDYFARVPPQSGAPPAEVEEAAPIDAWLAAVAVVVAPGSLPAVGNGPSRRRRALRGASRP